MATVPSSAGPDDKTLQTQETLDILQEISTLLNTGLDRESLVHCVKLCEMGANPEALASIIKELRRERGD
ncbi:Mitotic-spindle organizing protein 1 [Dispira parvispora]|uniref:Mitotic-spindle organizing protein 1 n=1 Tax=Dispira parvispora TaxID=1520584 RepID=A0A9W8AXK5_9FUNG|nr:Mitotic-spindle organizing protein 1 [Dispira parvispora]